MFLYVIIFSTALIIFLLLSTIAIMFHLSRTHGYVCCSCGSWYITSYSLFLLCGAAYFTALGAVSCLYFLSFTTPMPDILQVLEKLHCPKLLMELMLLIYRFIFVLLDTASALSTSQNCRLGNRDYKTSLKSFGMLGSVLMIRAVERSNRLYV